MSASLLNEPKCHGRDLVLIAGSWQLNGTSAVSLVKGSGFSVARSGVGIFDIAWIDSYYEVVSAVTSLEHTTEVASQTTWDAIDPSAKTGQIRLQTSGADADLAAGRVHFQVVFRKTSLTV
jgi:hypothetical protein